MIAGRSSAASGLLVQRNGLSFMLKVIRWMVGMMNEDGLFCMKIERTLVLFDNGDVFWMIDDIMEIIASWDVFWKIDEEVGPRSSWNGRKRSLKTRRDAYMKREGEESKKFSFQDCWEAHAQGPEVRSRLRTSEGGQGQKVK